MKVWILTLFLNGKAFTYDYKFYYKRNCDTIGKSYLNKRNLNKYKCSFKKLEIYK